MRGAVLKRPVAWPAGGVDIHKPSVSGGGSGGEARRGGLRSGEAEGEGGGGGAIGGGESVAASARVVKLVHRWWTPSVARWLRVRRVRCPSRSEHRCK